MKPLYVFLISTILLLGTSRVQAALPDGATAPDWTFVGIDGYTYHLYDILDSGYNVIIDVSAVWCGPCWTYHQSGTLESLYENYGPHGSNEVRVFYIEGDQNPLSELQGVGATQGDWTAGTTFPMILTDPSVNSTGPSKMSAYAISYFPTVYKICAGTKKIYEIGQLPESMIVDELNLCPATFDHDAALISFDGESEICTAEEGVQGKVTIKNRGANTLTSALIKAYDGGVEVAAFAWGGALAYGGTALVDMGIVPVSSSTTLEFRIMTPDDNAVNDKFVQPISVAAACETNVYLEILTDDHGAEFGWELRKSDGTLVRAEPSAGLYNNNQNYTYNFSLDPNECYEFSYYDLGGDGLTGSGYWKFFNTSDNTVVLEGAEMSETIASAKMNTGSATGIRESRIETGLSIQPNPAVSETQLQLFLNQTAALSYRMVNSLGEVVSEKQLGQQPAGLFQTSLDVADLPGGLYLLYLKAGEKQYVSRLTVGL